MGINLPCGNTPLTTTECGGDCDEKIERLAERVSEAEEKLDTIQEGAEVNVNADWEETDPNSDAYIENKPSVNYDLSLGDSAPTVGSAVVGSAVLGSLVDIILGRGDGTEDRVSVSGTGAIQITRDGDTMTIHVPVGEIDQLRNGTDTEARAWAANVLKQWLDERIAQIPADQFLDLNKTVFANPFTWSSTTYPGSINPNLDGKPVLVLALTDGENVRYSFLNMEDLIDAYEGVAPISVNGSQISHDNSGVTAGSYGDSSNQTPNFGDTFKALRSTVDAKGHVTSMSEHTVKIPDTLATQESAGLMSAEDKEKLDNVDQLYKTTCGNPITIDDADGEVKSLNVSLLPKQAGTPSQDSTVYNEPYLSKTSPSFNSEYDKLVGGTVAWNQLYDLNKSIASSDKGLTLTKDVANGKFTLNGTTTAVGNSFGLSVANVQNHVYFLATNGNQNIPIRISSQSYGQDNYGQGTVIRNTSANTTWYYVLNVQTEVGTAVSNYVIRPMVIDLTAMFGTTIADYIYSLEQANAGAGVAWFKKLFPKDYYAYNAGELMSVKPTAHVTSQTYPLAGVELRGIPKISNGALYYDGDTYASDGTVTRNTILRAYQSGDESLANAITDGTNTVVYSANASTETADPYQNPQAVGSTESYTDNRTVPIPVGHESTYANIYPISGYDNVNITDSNGTDTTTKTVTLPHTVYGADVDVTGGASKETWQNIASYNGETISEPWLSSMDEYVQGTTPTTGAQVCYELATPTDLQTTPTPLTLYKGDNVVSSDGDMCITYLQDRGDLTDFINEMKDCCEEVKGSLLENLVDGSAQGSLRGVDTAQEDANYTLGTDAVALGNRTKASGDYSVAEGTQTEASGLHSHAEGKSTIASGYSAHAEGTLSKAPGLDSHAEGHSTTASGDDSHAEGISTNALGEYSHAEGRYTTANSKSQHVGGEFNELDTTGTPTTRGTYVEIIGNGASNSARSNARTLDWNGNEALQGALTLGKGTADEVTITAAQLQQLLTLI